MIYVFIAVIQFAKDDLTTRQLIVSWFIWALITWTFLKQAFAFFTTFQRMVSESKVEMSAAASKDHEFVLLQAATFAVGAVAVYVKNSNTESNVVYFAYIMGIQSLAFTLNGIMIYFFNREPTDAEIDQEIETRRIRAKKD